MNPNPTNDCIDEYFVQTIALQYLKRRYQSYTFVPLLKKQVTDLLEARTNEGMEADGLIFYKDTFGYFIASLEAKSKKTINVLRPYFNETHFTYRQQIFMAIMGVLLFSLLHYLNFNFYHALIFGFLGFIVGNFLFFRRSKLNEKLYSTTDVFRQMRKYKANERWLAIPEDCLDEKTTIESLGNSCKREGVGLLIVSARGRVNEIIQPVKESGNYLPFYSADSRIAGLLPTGK